MHDPWYILGAGAIGGLFAAWLQTAGVGTRLLLRDHSHAALGADELSLAIDKAGVVRSYPLAVSACGDSAPIARLLVTTKAYDVCPAVASVAHRLDGDSQIVLLANGMGFVEELQDLLPGLNYFRGTTTAGAFRSSRWQLQQAASGSTRIGRSGQATAPGWFGDWQRAIPDCHWEPQIELALWRKLAINCVINPLTAIHGCVNGELASDPELARQVTALCAEIETICAVSGHSLGPAALEPQVAQVIHSTASNRSSMLQDVLAGRITEIDYINGYMVAEALRQGLRAPLNQELRDAVKAIVN